MESMWLSRAVYRKSMAVYGCEGESICSLPKRTVLFGSPGQCTDSLWQCRCLWKSWELYSSLGKYMCSLGLSTGSLGQSTAV